MPQKKRLNVRVAPFIVISKESSKMAEVKKYTSTKRFGARYGRKMKERFGKIDAIQRQKQKCPYCSAVQVKRVAAGIWSCRRCKTKFTGKAYSISTKILTKEPVAEEVKNG